MKHRIIDLNKRLPRSGKDIYTVKQSNKELCRLIITGNLDDKKYCGMVIDSDFYNGPRIANFCKLTNILQGLEKRLIKS